MRLPSTPPPPPTAFSASVADWACGYRFADPFVSSCHIQCLPPSTYKSQLQLNELCSPLSALRSPLSALVVFVSLNVPALAILDQNSDGMSDIWQSQYGFSLAGNIPSQIPSADPDGDGATNLQESIAGTNPLSSEPPFGRHRVGYSVNTANPLTADLLWQQFIGKQYRVETSTDLTAGSWTPLAAAFTANSASTAVFTTPPRSPAVSRSFQRVSVVDTDADADGLSGSEENSLGTNPNSPDSDSDGVPDKAEIIQNSSPNDPSDNGQTPPAPALLPMTLKIYTAASLATDYQDGGVNGLLTPYRIKIYEQNLATGVETLVYTTADYGGTMFALNETVTLPNLANDPNKRYNAQIDLPVIGIGIFDQPFRRWSFFINITASVGSAPFVGVNGFEPISQTFGTSGNILRAFNLYNPQFENYRAVIEPVTVSWKPIIGYNNVSAHVDPWGLPIAGSRIFPDFKNPLDNVLRAKLEVVVKTSAALAGKTVFVKAFDVDDSTSEAFDAPVVVDPNGKSGNDNLPDYLNTAQSGQFWTGAAWGGDTAQGVVDVNGETKFDFRVGMQPGNNYRVVASVVDASMITGVQVTSATAGKYLGPALTQNGGAPASPLLTVWRRLWVENDSMAAIPTDAFGYKRNDLSWNLDPPVINNRSFSSTTGNTSFGINAIEDQSSFLNLQNGRMIVQNIIHPVVSTASFQVTVAGDYSSVPVDSGFRLYDDDDFGLDAPPLPRLDLVDDLMKSFFKPAFIEVIDSGGFNLEKIIPFKINDNLQLLTQVNSKKDLFEKDGLWVAPLAAAYQFDVLEDGDPDDTLSTGGETQTDGGTRRFGNNDHSTVFVEACRESYDNFFRIVAQGGNPQIGVDARLKLKNYISAQASHEIGHQPGNDLLDEHLEDGLMRNGGALPNTPTQLKFTPKSISRFRNSKNWSKK
jgi:Bacterial TSP3 repeat